MVCVCVRCAYFFSFLIRPVISFIHSHFRTLVTNIDSRIVHQSAFIIRIIAAITNVKLNGLKFFRFLNLYSIYMILFHIRIGFSLVVARCTDIRAMCLCV